MTDERDRHSRRDLLLLLGIATAVPVAVGLTRSSEPLRGVVADVAVSVLAVGRRSRAPGGGAHVHEAQSWGEVVRVGLEAHNTGGTAVLLSPGQFRLQLPGPLSVMPCAWQHGPCALEPREVRRTWVEYRAPRGVEPLRLEFTAAGSGSPSPLLLAVRARP